MMIGITDEERKAFMMQMLPEQTADIKGEDNGESLWKRLSKCMLTKRGGEEFLVKWVGYPLSEATWEPFENLSGEEAREYQVIFIHKFTILVFIIT